MSAKSIEQLIETYGIELCRSHPQLKGKKMFHADSQQKAESDCLVFSATKGRDRLDELRASDVILKISYRSATGSPQQNSMVADAVDECFSARYSDKLDLPDVLRNFTPPFRIIDEDKTNERNDTTNQRQFTCTIPIIAKLR